VGQTDAFFKSNFVSSVVVISGFDHELNEPEKIAEAVRSATA
jgi:hypothetical protein